MAGERVGSLSSTHFWILCAILLITSINFITTEFTKEMVREWADRIGRETHTFTRNITHADDLQKTYEALNVSTTNVNGQHLLSSTKTKIEKYFNKKITALKNIVDKAENAYCSHKVNQKLQLSDIDYPNSKNLDSYLNDTGVKLHYIPYYLQNVTFNRSTIHVPTDVYDGSAEIVNGIKWSKELNEAFSQNEKADPSIAWQYFASNTGFMRIYPGSKWRQEKGQVDLYDARSRSWFIQGATSPKDVVIILDASGSMRGVPMRIAKLSAQALIDTFEDNDYFNIVWFNKEAEVLMCNENKELKLIQATKKNKQAAKEQIEGINDENVALWSTGVNLAFNLLEKMRKSRKGSQCQQALMIFSDGTTKNLKDLFKERNPDKRVRVFTYPVGPPAESTTAMLQMSKQNRGYFSRIQSVGAVRSVSGSYIQVLSRPMAMASKHNVTKSAVWTAVYLDALGLGMMVTGTMPVFYRPKVNNNCSKGQKNPYDHLIGVVGTDVPLKNLEDFFLQPLIGVNGYALGINNNGLIAFHPRLKTVFGYLPDAPGVDLMDVEFPLDKAELEKLRSAMINRTFSSVTSDSKTRAFKVYDVSRDELRVVKRDLHFYFDSLQDTSFSFGFATPAIGFKYDLASDASLEQIADKLNSSDLSLENWPYCDGTVFSGNPIKHLKMINLTCNQEMLNGLIVDLNATSNMWNIWTTDKSRYTNKQIKTVFAKTYYGVTRKLSFSNGENKFYPSETDFGRVASFDADDSSVVYTSPFTTGKRERNSTTVIAYKKVLYSNRPVAVTGYQMNSSAFSKMVFDKTKQCTSGNCPDDNCDRSGKNDHEGYYCYLLDENAFVVSSNTKKSSGMFFGKVDNSVMRLLIKDNQSSITGIYNKVVFTDYQAVCEKKMGFGNAGTSLLGPLFTVSSYIDWWTTKAIWFLMYFNVYSWLMSETKSFTEATEDKPKNYSCIKNVTTYYADKTQVLQNGTATCNPSTCSRPFIVANVPNSNLHLVVVDGKCGECNDLSPNTGLPGEPFTADDVQNKKCTPQLYRKRPQRCFETDHPESEYPAGDSRCLVPSLNLLALLVLLVWTYLRL